MAIEVRANVNELQFNAAIHCRYGCSYASIDDMEPMSRMAMHLDLGAGAVIMITSCGSGGSDQL